MEGSFEVLINCNLIIKLCIMISVGNSIFLKSSREDIFIDFREGGGEKRERKKKKHRCKRGKAMGCFLYVPNRYVPRN